MTVVPSYQLQCQSTGPQGSLLGREKVIYGTEDISKRVCITVPFVILKNWKQLECSKVINEFIVYPLKHVITVDLVFVCLFVF